METCWHMKRKKICMAINFEKFVFFLLKWSFTLSQYIKVNFLCDAISFNTIYIYMHIECSLQYYMPIYMYASNSI